MAKRKDGPGITKRGMTTAAAATTAAMEQRVPAFAEQLGRVVGTVQAKAKGWMDPDALKQQIAGVRDGAADLLEQFTGGAPKAAKKKKTTKRPKQSKQSTQPAAPVARGGAKGRSGGVVDARGKKHRKSLPSDPDATKAHSQAAKVRAAKTMVKTDRLRGRG